MKKRIAIDMDEVMADTLKARLERYNHEFKLELSKADCEGKHIYELAPIEHREALRAPLDEKGFFYSFEVFPHAQAVIEELSAHYEIFIATAAMEVPISFEDKYNWLLEHFPYLNPQHFVFCGDKSVIAADYLIDDTPSQLERFTGEGILYSAPKNRFVEGYKRVDDWLEVKKLFLG